MKIIVDENIPATTVSELQDQGYDVLDIRGTSDQGMTDQKLWQKAVQEKRLLISTYKGFAEHGSAPPISQVDIHSATLSTVKIIESIRTGESVKLSQ